MFLNVLKVLEDSRKLILLNELTTRYQYRYRKELDMLRPIVSRENELPNSEGVKQSKVLSIEQGDPSEAVEKRINLELLHPLPNPRFDSLDNKTGTMSMSLT